MYGWWFKYNFVLSAALDSSVSIAGVVIFFAIFYSGASSGFSWWGTEVHKVSFLVCAFFIFFCVPSSLFAGVKQMLMG